VFILSDDGQCEAASLGEKLKMTLSQKSRIERLTRELNLGSRADQGIKHVLGKMPVNMSESRANQVIDALQSEVDALTAHLPTDDDDIFGGF
jgi:hypothetical protein